VLLFPTLTRVSTVQIVHNGSGAHKIYHSIDVGARIISPELEDDNAYPLI
jgi:hypothetical protein